MQTERNWPNSNQEHLITDPQLVGEYFLELLESMELVEAGSNSYEGSGPYSHLKSSLSERIIGQDEAIESLVDTLNHEEFGDPTKPIGTFMFLGPTGVGKSQTAKEIARLLHDGSDKAFLNINCAQFKSYGDLTVLQGAPPGYIGYDQPSVLNEKVISQPKSVILFDEVEKAHPAFHDFLMQILDEGEISIFNTGKKLSIRNSIIILTSNAGSSEINALTDKRPVGFDAMSRQDEAPIPKSKLTDVAFSALERTFRPEFLGRIENKILFTHLTDEHHSLALDQYVRSLNLRDGYLARGVSVEVSPELRDYVVGRCTRRRAGGFREVRTSFRQTVERDLESYVRSGKIPRNSMVHAIPASKASRERNPDAVADFRIRRMTA